MVLQTSTAGLLLSLAHIGAERLDNLYYLHGKPWVNHRLEINLLQIVPSSVGSLVVPGVRGLTWLNAKSPSPKHALYGLCLRRAAEHLPAELQLQRRSNNRLYFTQGTLVAFPERSTQQSHPQLWVAYPNAPKKPNYIAINLHSNQPKPLEHFLQQLVNG